MEPASSKAVTREEARELDRRAIEEYGVPSICLMENAGRACADEAESMLGGAEGAALVLCGPGNNGGDGLVIARTLVNRGRPAEVVFAGARARLDSASEDVRTNVRLWRGLGRDVVLLERADRLEDLAVRMEKAPLVVDALFGTGLTRELREPYAGLVRAINASGRPVLAVDLPSGLDANTGSVLGEAVRATCTVTFVAPKVGFARGRGAECCGRVRVAEIGIPRPVVEGLEGEP